LPPLCSGNDSGKIILSIAIPESLRTFRDCIFTGKAGAVSGRFVLMRLFPISVPFVKMYLERPAGRDKHEYKNFISSKNAQSEAEGISNR
jgi:hypothetical protein